MIATPNLRITVQPVCRIPTGRSVARKSLHPRPTRSGFTLIEALIALSILAISGSALLLGVQSAIQTTNDSMDSAIAQNLARQLMDEIAGKRYYDRGAIPDDAYLGPDIGEIAGVDRSGFDDIDDYNGYESNPPVDAFGITIGAGDENGTPRHPDFHIRSSFFVEWHQIVSVYYVDENDPAIRLSVGQSSNMRAVEVIIYTANPDTGKKTLARIRRVFAYLPPPL